MQGSAPVTLHSQTGEVHHFNVTIPPATRAIAVRLVMRDLERFSPADGPLKPSAEWWRVTGRFRRVDEPAAAFVLHPPEQHRLEGHPRPAAGDPARA